MSIDSTNSSVTPRLVFASDYLHDQNDLDRIRELTSQLREADEIQTHDGAVFQRIQYQSKEEERLAIRLQHPKKARAIIECFEKTITENRNLNSFQKHVILQMIFRKACYLGVRSFEFKFDGFFGRIFLRSTAVRDALRDFQEEFRLMMEEMHQDVEVQENLDHLDARVNEKAISIITPDIGGHKTAALALEEGLQDLGYRVQLLNAHHGEMLESDPLFRFFGTARKIDIYLKFICLEKNPEKRDAYKKLLVELQKFIPDDLNERIETRIMEFGPQIIYSTFNYELPIIQAHADLDIPMTNVYTDWMHHSCVKSLLNDLEDPEFRVSLPYDLTQKEPKEMKKPGAGSVEELGFPVRSPFRTIDDLEEIQRIRQEYGVAPDEDVVIYQNGSTGMGSITDAAEDLLRKADNLPRKTHVFFLCGNNQGVYQTLQELEEQNARGDSNLIIHAMGFQNEDQMAKLYQISNFVVGKPGGATTAEICATGGNLLVHDQIRWEKENLAFLKRHSKGDEVRFHETIADAIIRLLKHPFSASDYTPVDWKQRFQDQIERLTTPEGENGTAFIHVKDKYFCSKRVVRLLSRDLYRASVKKVRQIFKSSIKGIRNIFRPRKVGSVSFSQH